MKTLPLLAMAALASAPLLHGAEPAGKHLFILSGQSNMAGLNPDESFTPAVTEAFGPDNVIVIKSAQAGMPIRNWYKQWKPAHGPELKPYGPPHLYDDLLLPSLKNAMQSGEIQTVTFVWMQGEEDARQSFGEVYADSLKGLLAQLKHDLGRDDVNFVIGRINDYDMPGKICPHWTMVRDAQVQVAESDPRFAWVDTDDLNDGKNPADQEIKNDLHLSVEGYKTLGQRFAEKSIALIKKQTP